MRAYMPYYNAERERMGQGAQYLPQLQQMEQQQQLQGGQLQEGYNQAKINEKMKEHYFNEDEWLNKLKVQGELLGPLTGTNQTTGPTQGQNIAGGAMGGGLMGYSLYDAYQQNNATPQYNATPQSSAPLGGGYQSTNYEGAIQPGANSWWTGNG